MLGWKYEEVLSLIEAARGGRAQPPRSLIRSFSLQGEVVEGRARMRGTLRVESLQSGWSRVPLGLFPGVIEDARAAVHHEGEGNYLLQVDPREGYVLYVEGKAGTEYTFEFPLAAPVANVGGRPALELDLPPSVAVEIDLSIHAVNLIVRSSTGIVDVSESTSCEAPATMIHVEGALGQPYRLTWLNRDEALLTESPLLEAETQGMVRLGPAGGRATFHVVVSSARGPLAEFRVRLPPDATLLEITSSGGAQFRLLPARKGEQTSDEGQELLVPAAPGGARSTSLSVQVDFAPREANQTTLSIVPPRVVNAVRQTGWLVFSTENGYMLDVRDSPEWRRAWAGDLPATLRGNQENQRLDRGYRYYHFPPPISVKVLSQPSRVVASCEYQLRMVPRAAELAMRLTLEVQGSDVFELRLVPQGWSLASVEPEGTFAPELIRDDEERLIIPLTAPRRGSFTTTFTFRRPTTSDSTRLQWRFPYPEVDEIQECTLEVARPAAALLEVLDAESTGLRRQGSRETTGEELSERYVLEQLQGAELVGVIHRTRHRTSWRLLGDFTIGPEGAEVRQILQGRIEFDPLEHLQLATASRDFSFSDWRLEIRDETGQVLASVGNESVSYDRTSGQWQARLPRPLAGVLFAELHFAARPRGPSADHDGEGPAGRWDLPLFLPMVDAVEEAEVVVRGKEDLVVQLADVESRWRLAEPAGVPGSTQPATFRVQGSPPPLRIALRPLVAQAARGLSVSRMWIQTWLATAWRYERVILRTRVSGEARLRMRLPAGSALLAGWTQVPGESPQPLDLTSSWLPQRREVSTLLSGGPDKGDVLVVLMYRSTSAADSRIREILAPPEFLDNAAVDVVDWQVLLPQRQMLLATAPGYVRAQPRQGPLSAPAGISQAGNVAGGDSEAGRYLAIAPEDYAGGYVFSRPGAPVPLQLLVVRRASVLFAGAAMVLFAGLLLLYLPVRGRQVVILAVGAIAWAASGALAEQAWIVLQALALGAILACLATYVARLGPGIPRRSRLSSPVLGQDWADGKFAERKSSSSIRALAGQGPPPRADHSSGVAP